MHFWKRENPAGMKRHENFHKILVANRGEIACRVIRAIRDLGKVAVVIHSDDDRALPFVVEADEAYSLGKGNLSETYLNGRKIVDIARATHVEAIHPGYGFLSENASFARMCDEYGIRFIGPDPGVIDLMGNKSNARDKARKLGLPVLEGIVSDLETLITRSKTLPYPLLIKPSAGGGGKGMRIVHSPERFEQEAREASREAKSYFGSPGLYVERYLENPRHIEVQVIADHHGHTAHLFERECSLQRRYQKIIEEAPSGFISDETRDRITASALQLVKGIGYTNAGTVEFLMNRQQEFFFLEMNTRIQVEHPVTEMVTGIDLVKEQIRISEGLPLSFRQEDIHLSGHSIEARIYAENPEKEFMPSAGRIDSLSLPSNGKSRIDGGFRAGNLVEPYYDPLISKIIVHGTNREDARTCLIRTLKDFRITGLQTNRDFLIELLRSVEFTGNRIHTNLVDGELQRLIRENLERRKAWDLDILLSAATLIALQPEAGNTRDILSPWYGIGHWRILPEIALEIDHRQYRIRYELLKGREKLQLHIEDANYDLSLETRKGNDYWIRINQYLLKVGGITDRSDILLDLDGHLFKMRRLDILDRRYITSGQKQDRENIKEVIAPLNGKVVQINVAPGSEVVEGDPLLVIESMKMENRILATRNTTVEEIHVSVGDQIGLNQLLITLK